jgi:2-keto-4-pentenoate hydratase/2-oxohepta-3-ene-1,7-dioic acid hydratase in catechol pathway
VRIARFANNGNGISWGLVEGERMRLLDGSLFDGIRPTDRTAPLERVRLLAPVLPGKIVALGLNYREHIREMGHQVPDEPVLFMKPPSALLGPGGAILLPGRSARVDHEAELALVVGRRCRNLKPADAAGALLGVTCINDVTARDLQQKDGQWTRAKGFDTFAPLGPWIETDEPEAHRRVECLVNGEVRQSGNTADLLFSPADILAFVSGIMTLEPGDVIATGTPPGVGPLAPGDRVAVRIEGIGELENTVLSADRPWEAIPALLPAPAGNHR